MPFTHIMLFFFWSGQGNDLAVLSQSLFIVGRRFTFANVWIMKEAFNLHVFCDFISFPFIPTSNKQKPVRKACSEKKYFSFLKCGWKKKFGKINNSVSWRNDSLKSPCWHRIIYCTSELFVKSRSHKERKKIRVELRSLSLDMLIRTLRADMITLNLKRREKKTATKLFSHFLMKINYTTLTLSQHEPKEKYVGRYHEINFESWCWSD